MAGVEELVSPAGVVVYGPDRPPVHPPPQERMKPILFCSWDLSKHEKWMPPSLNWDGLPVGRHFQKWPPPKLVELHFRL